MHLYNDKFNPVLLKADLKAFVQHKPIDPQVIDYNERLKRADNLIFIFHNLNELFPMKNPAQSQTKCLTFGW